MPGDDLTHGPPATIKQAAVATGSARSTGIPCAMVDGLYRALPGERAFLPPSSASSSRDLSLSVGRPGPRDFAVRAGHVGLTCHPRPSHPRLTCCDDRPKRPSSTRRDAREDRSDLPDAASTDTCARLARRAIRAWRACGICALGKWVRERDWALKERGHHCRQRTHRQQDWASLLCRQRYAPRQRPDAKHGHEFRRADLLGSVRCHEPKQLEWLRLQATGHFWRDQRPPLLTRFELEHSRTSAQNPAI
jgi:hypothetical protein